MADFVAKGRAALTARGTGAQNDGRCNPGSERWRHEGRASRARRNLGEGCCVQAEQGAQLSRGVARERKVVRTVSAPPRSVDRLRQNPVTYLANKIEFLFLEKE